MEKEKSVEKTEKPQFSKKELVVIAEKMGVSTDKKTAKQLAEDIKQEITPEESEKKPKKKPARKPDNSTYEQKIISAIEELKERNGSSRQAIKKYIHARFTVSDRADDYINKAIREGVEKGLFIQPKGPSGTVKIDKKKKVELYSS